MHRFTPPTSLTDGLVTLRPWHDDDAEALILRINDPDVAAFLDLVPQPYTAADAREWFAITAEGWQNATSATFADSRRRRRRSRRWRGRPVPQ